MADYKFKTLFHLWFATVKVFMSVIDGPSTRTLRSSRSSSPVQPLAATEPLIQEETSILCSVIREKLLTKEGDNPSIDVQETFRRKDHVNLEKQTLYGNTEGRVVFVGDTGGQAVERISFPPSWVRLFRGQRYGAEESTPPWLHKVLRSKAGEAC